MKAAKKQKETEAPKETEDAAGKPPQIGIERSRQRVQARTGLKGAGENKSFRFTDDGLEGPAVKEAQDWLRTRWVDELGRDPACLPFD